MAEKRKLPPHLKALPNVSRLLALVETCEGRGDLELPGMGVFHGRPGLGKTSAGVCCAVLRGVVHLTIPPFTTPKSLLTMLAEDFGLRPKRVVNELFAQVVGALQESGQTLLLDEADHLASDRLINTVRFLHDETKLPVILLGEEDLPQVLRQWPRVHGRVLEWAGADDATSIDVDLLVPLHAPGLEIAPDMRELLLSGSGNCHRYIVKNIHAIRKMALQEGLTRVGRVDWGDRPLDKGEPPKPRNLPPGKVRPARLRRVA